MSMLLFDNLPITEMKIFRLNWHNIKKNSKPEDQDILQLANLKAISHWIEVVCTLVLSHT